MLLTEVNLKEKIENLDWNFQHSNTELIHSIHPYPAKFIPEIPNNLISNLPIRRNTIILDPFCGSGVTLTEAQKVGIESVGIDLNPIACLLSRVKTRVLPENFIQIVKEIVLASSNFKKRVRIPAIPNLDHWFKQEVQIGLTILLNEINKITDVVILDSLKFCFSSIIVRVSNQDSDTRYAAVDKKWGKDDVFILFKQSAEKLWRTKTENTKSASVTVMNKDSLLISDYDFPKEVGLVITSPPYPNAYEYWLYHKYRMWWLGYDPISVKESEIGARAHYFKKNHHTADDFIVQMTALLQGLYEKCCKDAFLCFVIGQSKIHGQIIENEQLIRIIGEQIGFSHFTTFRRDIRQGRKSFNLSHARIKEEFIVILQK